jgi:hypothetical protein
MLSKLVAAGAALFLLGGAVTALARSLGPQSSRSASVASRLPPATAEVTRATLVETKTVSGTLGFGEATPVRAILSTGTGLLTWLAPEGSTVSRGEPLFAIDGRPVVLFYGDAPFFRTLRFNAESFDTFEWVELETAQDNVRQAELNLELAQARLTEAEGRVAEADVRVADSGREEPQTPEFVDLRGALVVAERRLASAQTLSESGAASEVSLENAERTAQAAQAALDAASRNAQRQLDGATADAASVRVSVLAAERALRDERERLEAMQLSGRDNWDIRLLESNLRALGYEGSASSAIRAWQADLGAVPSGIVGPDQIVVTSGPVRVGEHRVEVGDVIVDVRGGGALNPGAQNVLLSYTETAKLATVSLSIADRRFAAVGSPTAVILPDGREVTGVISEVSAVISEAEEAEVIVAIPDQEALGDLEAATVDVEFSSERREDVLTVPVSALLARPEGGFGVEIVEGRASRIAPVRTGMFAGGRVEISGEEIAEGVKVGVPQ